MAQRTTSLFGAIARGKLAGALGTAAMDVLWYSRHRLSGGDDDFVEWEFASNVRDWSDAPAPAQFGKRVGEAVLGYELSPDYAAATTNFVHWATGAGWGGLYGLAARSNGSRRLVVSGVLFGTGVWATSYVVLPLAKVYKPIWEYEPGVLWKDLSAHWVYGVVTAAAFRLLGGR